MGNNSKLLLVSSAIGASLTAYALHMLVQLQTLSHQSLLSTLACVHLSRQNHAYMGIVRQEVLDVCQLARKPSRCFLLHSGPNLGYILCYKRGCLSIQQSVLHTLVTPNICS